MSTLSNNLTQGCDLTHEKLIPETEFTKTTDSDFDATSLPIFTDMENGAESDSNVAEFNNESEDISNATEFNNESEDISNVTESNNASMKCSIATDFTQKEASDIKLSASIRTDGKRIQQIKSDLEHLGLHSFGNSQIIQLAVSHSYETYVVNENKASKNERKKAEAEEKKAYGNRGTTITFRLPAKIKNAIMEIYDAKTLTFAVNCCLIDFQNYIHNNKAVLQRTTKCRFPYVSEKLENSEYLFYRLGLKNKELLQIVTQTIEELRITHNCTTYCEPCTGTANVLLHLITKFETEKINDKEQDLTNLLLVIQEWADEFIFELLQYPVDKGTFDKFQKKKSMKKKCIKCIEEECIMKKHIKKLSRGKKNQIHNAIETFYTILLSYYGKGDHLKKNATDRMLLNKLIPVQKIHQRLSGTAITNNDIFYLLDEFLKSEDLSDVLFYFDPPYIRTESYYQVSKENLKNKLWNASFHKKLKKKILRLKEKNAIIVTSYRATISKNNASKLTDEMVQEILDDLYWNEGFFIQFVKVKNEQIEIILTSEEVTGSIPYNDKIATLIQKYVK